MAITCSFIFFMEIYVYFFTKKRVVSFLFIFLTIVYSVFGFCEGLDVKVLILPFHINSEKDLSYLKSGIKNMLYSKLSVNGDIEIVDYDEIADIDKRDRKVVKKSDVADGYFIDDPSQKKEKQQKDFSFYAKNKIIDAGNRVNADYVIAGQITVFGETVSTDFSLIEVKSKKTRVLQSDISDAKGSVIKNADLFAGKLSHFFNINGINNIAGSNLKTDTEQIFAGLWKSREFNLEINSIVMADINGDGKSELVFSSEKEICVYKKVKKRLERICEFKNNKNGKIIHLETADLNNNGKFELFVTNVSKKGDSRLKSYILEYDTDGFKVLESRLRWYLGSDKSSKRVKKILCQKQNDGKKFFKKNIHELVFLNGKYIKGDLFLSFKKLTVFGLTVADALNKGCDQIVSYTNQDMLLVSDYKSGEKRWISSEPYGGNVTYLELDPDKKEYNDTRIFLKQRIIVSDLDGDGKNELIVSKNKEAGSRLFKKFRSYRSGHIESLFANELGFTKKWETQEISGYIADFAVGDIDNCGKNSLIFAVVKKSSGFFEKSSMSYIVFMKKD